MNMNVLNEGLFVNLSILSHRDFPMTESFFHRGKFPLKVTEKLPSKVYIVNLTDSLSTYVTEKASAVAPLLMLFTVTMRPLTAFLSKELKERINQMGKYTDYFDNVVDKTNGKKYDSQGQMIIAETLASIACSLAAIADALDKGDDE